MLHRLDQPGVSFGELALLYSSPRSATIRACAPCVLWALGADAFREIAVAQSAQHVTPLLVEFLSNVPLLATLDRLLLEKMAAALEHVYYNDGDRIIRQGDHGSTFFVIVRKMSE